MLELAANAASRLQGIEGREYKGWDRVSTALRAVLVINRSIACPYANGDDPFGFPKAVWFLLDSYLMVECTPFDRTVGWVGLGSLGQELSG